MWTVSEENNQQIVVGRLTYLSFKKAKTHEFHGKALSPYVMTSSQIFLRPALSHERKGK